MSIFVSLRGSFALLASFLLIASCSSAQPPQFGERTDRGLLQNDAINEASGLAASRRNPGLLWTNNDSGDTTRVFAMTTSGKNLGEFYLEGTSARDWEEVAVGPGPQEGISYLFVGEIGDNAAAYDTKRIYRVPEPEVDTVAAPTQAAVLRGVETITYRYPDGARDAEAFFVDPLTRDIYVVSKRETSVRVYRASWPQSTTETITLEHVGTLDGITQIVAGDISVDGGEILLKNYTNIFYWRRQPGKSVADAFKSLPDTVPYLLEPQGESVAWSADGSGYYTTSEEPQNIPAHLYFYPRKSSSSVKEENNGKEKGKGKEKGMGESGRRDDQPDLSVAARWVE